MTSTSTNKRPRQDKDIDTDIDKDANRKGVNVDVIFSPCQIIKTIMLPITSIGQQLYQTIQKRELRRLVIQHAVDELTMADTLALYQFVYHHTNTGPHSDQWTDEVLDEVSMYLRSKVIPIRTDNQSTQSCILLFTRASMEPEYQHLYVLGSTTSTTWTWSLATPVQQKEWKDRIKQALTLPLLPLPTATDKYLGFMAFESETSEQKVFKIKDMSKKSKNSSGFRAHEATQDKLIQIIQYIESDIQSEPFSFSFSFDTLSKLALSVMIEFMMKRVTEINVTSKSNKPMVYLTNEQAIVNGIDFLKQQKNDKKG